MEFTPLTGDLLCIPIACETIEESNDVVSESNNPSYILLRFFRAFPFIMKIILFHIKRRGIIPMFWVLNKENEFISAYNYGASGIITDYPVKALKYFQKKNIKIA